MSWLPNRELNQDPRRLTGLVALALALFGLAGVGMAYVAGFTAISRQLGRAQLWWLGPASAAFAVAFLGYFFAYRGIRRAHNGPRLGRKATLAVAIAGFGGLLDQGAGALDEYAMRAGGASEREAKVRAGALAGFEQGVLALIVCPACALALVLGLSFPRPGFTWPWAVIPLPALLIAVWLSVHYRDRLRERAGWRGRVGIFLDSIHLVTVDMFLRPRAHLPAVAGMAAYWGGEMTGLWATTAAFGYRMSALAVIVGLASGMFIPRRAAPLGGAGILTLALVPTLWYGSGVPLAAATLGVLAYRVFTLWIPLIPGWAALPALRAVGERGKRAPARGTRATRNQPVWLH